MRQRRHLIIWAYGFLALPLILFVLIEIYPLFSALWISLQSLPVFGASRFLGLGNYERMLGDPLFWQSMKVTFLWTFVVVPAVMALGLGVAVALNQSWMRGTGIFRTVYFIPVVVSLVAAGFAWRWLFEPSAGVVNFFVRTAGLPGPGWLADTTFALPAVMVVGVWQQIGYAMVLFLAGLQTIPRDFSEAAEIDGASSWQVFRHVTIPLLNPTIVFVAIVLTINAFRVFTIPYVMSAGGFTHRLPGGPLDSTRVFVLHIYDIAFKSFDMGYGAANAVVLLVLIMAVTLIQLRVIQRSFRY
jgi:multiple sugar transport system permease protein